MRSARSVFIFYEALTFTVIVLLAVFLVVLLQGQIKKSYIDSQQKGIDKVNLLINNFLEEKLSEFSTIKDVSGLTGEDYRISSFDDVYYLDRDLRIFRIIKKEENSNIFEGYDLSRSRAGEFFRSVESGSGTLSTMFRSPENDTLSIYIAAARGSSIIAGRISIASLTRELGRMVEFDGSILLFTTDDGFVLSSSREGMPPHIAVLDDHNEIIQGENYLLSSKRNLDLDSIIVLLNPMSEVYNIISSTMIYYPISIAVLLLIMAVKIVTQLFLFVKPLEKFTRLLLDWDFDRPGVVKSRFASGIREVGILYDTFYDKALQLKESVVAIRSKEEETRRMRGYLRSIIDSMPSVLISIDREFIINEWNDAAVKLTGKMPSETTGRSLYTVIPEMRKFESTLKDAWSSETIIEFKRERIENFQDRLFNILLFPVGSGNSKDLGIRLDDVTELFKAEQNLVQSQKMEVIGTLAGGLAHDFNNILAAIIGSVSILQLRFKSSFDLNQDRSYFVKYLDMLEESSSRASGVITQLLTLSRKRDYEMKPLDLNSIITSVENICSNSFDKSVEIKVEKYDGEAVVNGDTVQLEQILLNLCINGAHAMTIMRGENEKQGGVLSISIEGIKADEKFVVLHPEAAEGESYWALSVSDTGVGIKKSIVEKIFDPFFTTKSKGRGSGLGLSMVYGIVQMHGGFIDIYTEEGAGASFIVYIPVLDQISEQREFIVKNEVFKWDGTVLVIDDEYVIRDVACELLSILGFNVLTASNGNEGIDVYRREGNLIKFVILDMIMPGMTGLETFIELKKIKDDVKVLLSSGFRNDERIQKALELGVEGFLQKPYSMEQFSEAVNKMLRDK